MTDSSTSFYVYMLFRLNGLPCYVGKGKGNRWERHQGRKKNSNLHLGSIIDQARAAGKELPRVKVAEGLTESSALELEILLIGCIGRGENGPLVNLTDGGDGTSGYKYSEEQRARHGAIRKGQKLTPEWRAAVSAGLKGKPKSPEHAAKVGAAQKGKVWVPPDSHIEHLRKLAMSKPHKGHRHSPETVEKIRAARLRQTNVSTVGQFKKRETPAARNEGDLQ